MNDSPIPALALLAAEHTPDGALADVAAALCRTRDPRVLAAVAVRPDTPSDVAADAIGRLWKPAGRDGHPVDWCRQLVARCDTLAPGLQLLVVGSRDTHCATVAGHTTDVAVIGALLDASADVEAAWRLVDGQQRQAPRSGALHALPVLAGRARDDEGFAALLAAAGFTRTLTSLLCGAAPADADELLEETALSWGPRNPEGVSDAVLRSGRHELTCQVGSRGWASTQLRDTVLGWIRDELRGGPTAAEEAVFSALHRVWDRLDGAQRDELRGEIRSAAHLPKGREEWLRRVSVRDSERDAAADGERWRRLPVDQAVPELEVLGHKLPLPAAELFVSRPDVSTDLAYTVAVKSAHLSRDWLTARPFDPEFTIRHLARVPGWIDVDDLDVEAALAVLVRSARHSTTTSLAYAAKTCAPLFGPEDYLRLPWDVLARVRDHDAGAAAALASMVAPLFASDVAVKSLERVLDSDWGQQLPAGEVLAAVAAAGR